MDGSKPLEWWSPSSAPDPVRVRLWLHDLDGATDATAPPLAPEEEARAARLRGAIARRRFVARCRFLRATLGRLSGLAPEALRFRSAEGGKPQLVAEPDGRTTPLRFNLAHSAGVLALAVCSGRDVGVDVEVVDPAFDPMQVASVVLPPEQVAALAALPRDEARREFYARWTVHEALAKADGQGLVAPLAPDAAQRWLLHPFHHVFDGKEIVGAVALAARA